MIARFAYSSARALTGFASFMMVASLALVPVSALARLADMEVDFVRRPASVREEQKQTTVQVSGKLEMNGGKYRITDTASGKTYQVAENTEISKRFANGERNIRVEGVLTGDDTIEARSVNTL